MCFKICIKFIFKSYISNVLRAFVTFVINLPTYGKEDAVLADHLTTDGF